MKILRNYILKDFFSAFIFSLLSLTMVMLLGNLGKISDMIIRKGVGIIDALKILSFLMPYLLGFTIPLSFLLGILIGLGRLIADNETVAMQTAGISLFKILKVFLALGVIFSLFIFILYDRVIPDFHYRYRKQIKNIYSKNISSLIEPGVFLENFQNRIIYVSDVEENKLKNIFIYEINDKDSSSRVTFAKRGEFAADKDVLKMKLEDGFRDEESAKNKNALYRLNFEIFFMDIPITKREKVIVEKKPSDMRLKELLEKIKKLKRLGISSVPVEMLAELHERISFSLSVFTFIFLGFGLSLIVRHREKSINFVVAFLAAGIYYLLFMLGKALVEYRLLIPSLGMWLPNIIIGPLGIYLFYKNAHFR